MEIPARLLVFDLDGTLVDSKEDLAVAVNVAIESFDLPPLPHATIYGYVGDGASATPGYGRVVSSRCLR